eukprot:SAG31_NODE_1897_length_6964_cov_2.677349_10_plen_66_part_01
MDDCVKNSWTHYINESALTSVIICTGFNETQLTCAAARTAPPMRLRLAAIQPSPRWLRNCSGVMYH